MAIVLLLSLKFYLNIRGIFYEFISVCRQGVIGVMKGARQVDA